MDHLVKNEINSIIARHKFVMFEFREGKVYWLYEHHRYVDPEDAKRILIGVCNIPSNVPVRNSNRNLKSKITYLTHPI